MPDRSSRRIEPCRRKEIRKPVAGDDHLPLVAVGILGRLHQTVVVMAEQNEVRHAGRRTGPPGVDVVGLTQFGAHVAAGEGAAAVAYGQRTADCSGDKAVCASDVERLGRTAQHHRDDLGVAAHLTQLTGAQLLVKADQASGGSLVVKVLVVQLHNDPRRAGARFRGGIGCCVQQVDEGVRAALLGCRRFGEAVAGLQRGSAAGLGAGIQQRDPLLALQAGQRPVEANRGSFAEEPQRTLLVCGLNFALASGHIIGEGDLGLHLGQHSAGAAGQLVGVHVPGQGEHRGFGGLLLSRVQLWGEPGKYLADRAGLTGADLALRGRLADAVVLRERSGLIDRPGSFAAGEGLSCAQPGVQRSASHLHRGLGLIGLSGEQSSQRVDATTDAAGLPHPLQAISRNDVLAVGLDAVQRMLDLGERLPSRDAITAVFHGSSLTGATDKIEHLNESVDNFSTRSDAPICTVWNALMRSILTRSRVKIDQFCAVDPSRARGWPGSWGALRCSAKPVGSVRSAGLGWRVGPGWRAGPG